MYHKKGSHGEIKEGEGEEDISQWPHESVNKLSLGRAKGWFKGFFSSVASLGGSKAEQADDGNDETKVLKRFYFFPSIARPFWKSTFFLSKSNTELLGKVSKEYRRCLAEFFVVHFGRLVSAKLESLPPSCGISFFFL